MSFAFITFTYFFTGAVAGVLAGLLGVGGGIIIVPALVMVFTSQGFSLEVMMHMAIATSLATIVFTSLSSIQSHHARGGVDWSLFRMMSVGVCIGATLGVLSVMQLSGEHLRLIIGVFATFIAVKMLFSKDREKKTRRQATPKLLWSAGLGIGWFSSLLGIGGGTLSVPFLSALNLSMQRAIGTAAACGFPIALTGAIANMLVTQFDSTVAESLPAFSVGYVYLPAVFGLSLTSVIFAKLGARIAHRLPAVALKKAFGLSLLLVGIKFLFF
jgi:hypothetical protein